MSPFWLIGFLLLSVGGVALFNILPHRWFLDYGESPGESRRKLPFAPASLVFCILMAGAWLAAGRYLSGAAGPLMLLLVWMCMMISASDILYHILPDQFILAIALIGVALVITDRSRLVSSLLGCIIGGGTLLLIGLLGKLVYKAEAMGFGDVKLMAALGLICGLPGILCALAIALLTGALAALPMLFEKGSGRRYLPFAPCLCLGAVASVIFARPLSGLFQWYLSLFP